MPDEIEFQTVSEEEADAAIEHQRRKNVVDFANFVGNYNFNCLTSYTAALANFETTTSHASLHAAQPDLIKVCVKVACDEAFKELGRHIAKEASAGVGALLSFGKAIHAEVERAAAAQVSQSVGAWIKLLRTGATDAYLKHGSPQALLTAATRLYADAVGDDERQTLIDALTYWSAFADPETKTLQVPGVQVFECGLYQGWVRAHFSIIGQVDDDITGFLDVRFDSEGEFESADLMAPLSEQISDALNVIAPLGGYASLMELAVHKRVSKWSTNAVGGEAWVGGWFDEENQLINEPNSEEVTSFLREGDWMRTVTLFRHV